MEPERPREKVPIPGTDGWLRVTTSHDNVFYAQKRTKRSSWTIPDEIREQVVAFERSLGIEPDAEESEPEEPEEPEELEELEESEDPEERQVDEEPPAKRARAEEAGPGSDAAPPCLLYTSDAADE